MELNQEALKAAINIQASSAGSTEAVMQQALDALENAVMHAGGETGCDHKFNICFCKENAAIEAIRAALAQERISRDAAYEATIRLTVPPMTMAAIHRWFFDRGFDAALVQEPPQPDTTSGDVSAKLREVRFKIATHDALSYQDRHDLNVPLMEAQLLISAIERTIKEATAREPAAPQEPAVQEPAKQPNMEIPAVCDGKEQAAFEAWAKSQKYNMDQHPILYLFLDSETNAARDGWREAIAYCASVLGEKP